MLEQKPPRRQPSPSVNSLNTTESAPNVMPEKKTATRYAPWIALVTGGFITYIIRTLGFCGLGIILGPSMQVVLRVTYNYPQAGQE